MAAAGKGFAAEAADIANVQLPSITIPSDFTDSLAQDAKPGKFEGRGMSGAQVFANVCHGGRLFPGHGRSYRNLGHRGARFHQYDYEYRGCQFGPHAPVGARQQYADRWR